MAPDSLQAKDPTSGQLASSGSPAPILDLFSEITALAIRLRQRIDVAGAEHRVLGILESSGTMTVPQIARERATSRQNIQILVNRLQAEGLVEVSGNPAHKRSALVHLTEHGRAWLNRAAQAQKDLLGELGSQLSESEMKEAAGVLRKIRNLLSAAGQDENHASRPSGPAKVPSSLPKKGKEPQPDEFPISLL